MIGRTLAGRYLVESRVGGGGMAAVYRGVDTFLHRQVALKVLRSQFADDAAFVSRFRREARAAASLSHPNIVAAYDVGQDGDDCYFIVQEFVDGRTLKERIQNDGPLSVEEALDITLQVLRALAHAHALGVVHRDVKPQNVLLTQDGRVKVTDFGIARAEVGATFVHTGAILGTAHYAAPEQVRGQDTDERCDLYSTGVMLYEMLVGHPPFDGDTPLAVALQHVEKPTPNLAAALPDIDPDITAIVTHSLAKAPDDRYRSTAEMIADITAVQEGGHPVYAPGLPVPALPEPHEEVDAVAPPRSARSGGNSHHRRPQAGRGRRVGLIVGSVLLVGAAVAAGVLALSAWLHVPQVTVPSLLNDDITTAQAALNKLGLQGYFAQEYSAQVPAGDVVSTSPTAGTLVKRASQVQIYMSLGPQQMQLPDLAGLTTAAAESELQQMGLTTKLEAGPFYSSTVPQGYILGSSPGAGTEVAPGATVYLQVSSGPAAAGIMPNYVGRLLQAVETSMSGRSLKLGSTVSERTGWPSGIVAATSPVAGAQAPAGTTVDLTVSSGCVYQASQQFVSSQSAPASSATGSGGATSASGSSGSSSSAASTSSAAAVSGLQEQVLIQDVGSTESRLIYNQTVPFGQAFTVQLCWSSPQGATWTWEENGVVKGSGVVTSSSAVSGTGAGSSTSSGSLPSNPSQPGQSGVPPQSSTKAG